MIALAEWLGAMLTVLQIDLHPKLFRHVLTFIYESDTGKMTCSVSPTELFYNFDLRSARDASGTGVCRASFKLSETVHRLSHGRSEGQGSSVPALDLTKIDRALDIGAAPGGWTAVLVALGVGEVIAIDPGMLDDDVLAMPGVKHMRMRVETATPVRTSRRTACTHLLTAVSAVAERREESGLGYV